MTHEQGPDSDTQLDPTQDTCQSLLQRRRDAITRLALLTTHGLTKQSAHCLLRLFTSSDFIWTARTMGVPIPTASQLDDQVVAAIVDLHGLRTTTPHNAMIFFHPVSEGGLGFTSATAVRAGALAASWSFCLSDVLAATGFADLLDLAFHAPPLQPPLRLTQRLHEELFEAQSVVNLPLPPHDVPRQRAFTQMAIKHSIAQWNGHPTVTPADSAWRLSCGAPMGAPGFSSHPPHATICLTRFSTFASALG